MNLELPAMLVSDPETREGLAEPRRVPLALLVDRLLGDGPRGRGAVREFSRWLAEHADRLRLLPLDALGLVDVVLTFRMKQVVTLVATGRHPQHPGEVTVRFAEPDFPFIEVELTAGPQPEPYEVCTLNHEVEGRPLALTRPLRAGGREWPAGTPARALLDTTIGLQRHLRIALPATPDLQANVAFDAFRWLDETPAE